MKTFLDNFDFTKTFNQKATQVLAGFPQRLVYITCQKVKLFLTHNLSKQWVVKAHLNSPVGGYGANR